MATCPEPLPAPGAGLGLLLPLAEKIRTGNPNISRCICSPEAWAAPRASGERQGRAVEQPCPETGAAREPWA